MNIACLNGISKPLDENMTVSPEDCGSSAIGRHWLDELTNDAVATAERIAEREGCSARKVNMTISLAFLAPDLVKAAIEGRLPNGMGVDRLADLPAEWSKQHKILGLHAH
jgi:site-specific DNA recombinase